TCEPVAPSDRPALVVKPGRNPVEPVGPVHVVLDVLFAGPDHLHRTVHLLCDLDRANDAVGIEPAAEAAANQMVVDHTLLDRQAGGFRGSGLGTRQRLAADPDFATVLLKMNGAV